MSTKRICNVSMAIALAALLLSGCGPKPPPEGPGDVPPPPPGAAAPVKPKRTVSKEAKSDFADAVKEYTQVKGTGLNQSNCGKIAAAFADVYESHPKVAEAKFNEGVVWEECRDLKKAEQAYQALLRQHPRFGPALNNLGQLYFARGDVSSAMTYFKRAAELKNSEGYANLAVIQRNQAIRGDVSVIKEAVNNVHRSLAVDSFNIEAYATLAQVLFDHAKTQSQLEMARLICVQATKVDDAFAPIYNILGLILLQQGKVTPALAEFKKAVSINNNFMEAHMNIGAITISFRDYKTAEESFTQVLALGPPKRMKIEALVGLGVAYRGQRKFNEAMQKYKEALRLDPSNIDIAYNQGILIQDYTFDAGNPGKAISDLQTAANYLQQYANSGRNQRKIKDAQRRLKNINELIPMLREQQKMMREAGAGGKG
jgi:tetratricopeptide (TPR) repeat protein